MSNKTKKSYLKRLKVTRNGKILARATGQNHFNAKERSRTSGRKHRMTRISMPNKIKARFLVNMM